MQVICVWSDYTWCYEEDLESYTHMSDDYMRISVPNDVEDIDVWLHEIRPQG